MATAFVSYAREDRDVARLLADQIESEGWQVWWDLRLAAGESFDEEIERHLNDADAVLVLWSKASAASRWVKAEADVGLDRGRLVPVRLDDTEIPLPFRRIHTADLSGWQGSPSHPGMAEVRSALTRLSETQPTVPLGRAPSPTPTAGRPRWIARLGGRRVVAAVGLGLVAIVTVLVWTSRPPSDGTVEVPNVIGMRLDQARVVLDAAGIHGPGERDTNNDPFPEDVGDLETRTRVADVSPPPGTKVDASDPDVTLLLEFCDGTCVPLTTSPGGG